MLKMQGRKVHASTAHCPVCKTHVPPEWMTSLDGGRLCQTCKDDILERTHQPGTSVERSRQEISAEVSLDTDFNFG